MIMFLVLNTSGLTLIPVSIMVYRVQAGALQPTVHLYTYSYCHILLYFGRNHYHFYLSTHQSFQQNAIANAWRNACYGVWIDLGFGSIR